MKLLLLFLICFPFSAYCGSHISCDKTSVYAKTNDKINQYPLKEFDQRSLIDISDKKTTITVTNDDGKWVWFVRSQEDENKTYTFKCVDEKGNLGVVIIDLNEHNVFFVVNSGMLKYRITGSWVDD